MCMCVYQRSVHAHFGEQTDEIGLGGDGSRKEQLVRPRPREIVISFD